MDTRKGSRLVRMGAWAALIAGAALVVKVAHIFAVDGSEHVLQAILYLGGIALAIPAAIGVGASYGSTKPRKVGWGFLAFFGFVFFIMMLSDAVGAAIGAVYDAPAYVGDEVPIALAGLAWLAVGYRLLNKGDRSVGTA